MFLMLGHVAYKVKGEDVRKILNTLEPGDVLLRRYNAYLSGLMIPGYFTHAAIYVGDNSVVHLLGDGICKEDILTFTRCDDLMILRHVDDSVAIKAIKLAWDQLSLNVEYDFDFNTKCSKRFYCTEFIDFCYGNIVKKNTKRSYIVPDDFINTDLKIIYKGIKYV